jgi:GntR family histidine utilization transcriptional repressor
MNPSLDADGKPGALYEKVKRHILEHIHSGEWASGARVPSENELVRLLGVSRMTVHRALRELSSQGLLARVQGVGTFVTPARAKSELLELRDVGDDVVARGHEHSVKVIAQEAVRANPDMALMFDLRPGAKVFHSLLVHFEDELPIQQEERFVRPSFAPAYLDQDFTRQAPGNYLMSIAPPTELDHVVFAVLPDRRARKVLRIAASEPCLMLTRRTWVTGVPVTRSSFVYPGSRYSLGSRHKL